MQEKGDPIIVISERYPVTKMHVSCMCMCVCVCCMCCVLCVVYMYMYVCVLENKNATPMENTPCIKPCTHDTEDIHA